MKSLRDVETAVTDGLQKYLGCPVIRSNTNTKVPPYPYVSFTIISLVQSVGGSWCIDKDGRQYKDLSQTWSLTVQSNDPVKVQQLALDAAGWFDTEEGHTYLKENEISVQSIGNVTNRDNLLSIEYEYREGFDVTLLLRHYTKDSIYDIDGTIETI